MYPTHGELGLDVPGQVHGEVMGAEGLCSHAFRTMGQIRPGILWFPGRARAFLKYPDFLVSRVEAMTWERGDCVGRKPQDTLKACSTLACEIRVVPCELFLPTPPQHMTGCVFRAAYHRAPKSRLFMR